MGRFVSWVLILMLSLVPLRLFLWVFDSLTRTFPCQALCGILGNSEEPSILGHHRLCEGKTSVQLASGQSTICGVPRVCVCLSRSFCLSFCPVATQGRRSG